MARTKQQVRFLSPKHSWKDAHRLVLVLLDLCYQNHVRDITAIFNHIHRNALLGEGFRNGVIPTSSITAQLRELRQGGTGSNIYDALSLLSSGQLRNIFSQQLSVIIHTAQTLQIDLVDKNYLEQPRVEQPLRQRAVRISITPSETTVTTWVPNSQEDDEEYHTPTRKYRRVARVRSGVLRNGGLLSPIVTLDDNGLLSQRRPYFLFRAFELQHGLQARRYLQAGTWVPPPPKFRSSAFGHEVRPHLNRDPRYASPWLSFAQNPAVAIRHAFNNMNIGAEMALAVFRYDDLRQDAVSRFGSDSGPYLVPVICKQHELYDLPGSYTGTGEFLIWGSVNVEPVTVISGTDTIMIRAILRTTKILNFESGARLSKYLPSNMSDQHLELFLYQLVTGYKVAGHRYARKNTKYLEFVRGTQNNPDKAHDEDYHIVNDVDMADANSDADSDFEIVEVRPVRHKQKHDVFPMNDWRSDTTGGEIYDIYMF